MSDAKNVNFSFIKKFLAFTVQYTAFRGFSGR